MKFIRKIFRHRHRWVLVDSFVDRQFGRFDVYICRCGKRKVVDR
jgi:hypothetical protein